MTFLCDKDYTLEGTNTTYCQADKSWSAAVPRCLGKSHLYVGIKETSTF